MAWTTARPPTRSCLPLRSPQFGTFALLTSRGRKSGRRRRTALYYGRDGGAYPVVASNGGSSKHPLRYLNLREHPLVEVQVGSEIFEATARPATAAERSRLWQVMAAAFPPYDGMQQKTKREIPVVVIEPVGSEQEPHVLSWADAAPIARLTAKATSALRVASLRPSHKEQIGRIARVPHQSVRSAPNDRLILSDAQRARIETARVRAAQAYDQPRSHDASPTAGSLALRIRPMPHRDRTGATRPAFSAKP